MDYLMSRLQQKCNNCTASPLHLEYHSLSPAPARSGPWRTAPWSRTCSRSPGEASPPPPSPRCPDPRPPRVPGQLTHPRCPGEARMETGAGRRIGLRRCLVRGWLHSYSGHNGHNVALIMLDATNEITFFILLYTLLFYFTLIFMILWFM